MAKPHDKLFRRVFDEPRNAAPCFERFLPDEVVTVLDLSHAQLTPGTFVTSENEELETDLLYEVPLRPGDGDHSGEEPPRAFLYVLWEHQSTPDRWLALRKLGYMYAIWERWHRENPQARQLPPIVPLVLLQGPERWQSATELVELVRLPVASREALRPFVPSFRYLVTELQSYPDEQLPEPALARLALLLLKYSREPELLARLRTWLDLIGELMRQGEAGRVGLRIVVGYILEVRDDVEPSALSGVFREVSQEAAEMATSMAEQLENRGRERGRLEGRQEGRQEERIALARRLLERGQSVEAVAELVELPVAEIRKLAT